MQTQAPQMLIQAIKYNKSDHDYNAGSTPVIDGDPSKVCYMSYCNFPSEHICRSESCWANVGCGKNVCDMHTVKDGVFAEGLHICTNCENDYVKIK